MPLKSGLVSISFRKLSPDQIVDLVVSQGLQGIEWGGDVHVPHGDLDMAEAVGQLTRDAGLSVASYGSYYRFAECDPHTFQEGPTFTSVLLTAKALGAPAIRVWAGKRGPDKTSRQMWASTVDKAREVASQAEAIGIRLDLEYHENTLTETPESTLEFLRAVNHSNLKTLWQPPLKTSPEERLAGLKKVAPWVSNIHCNYFGQNAWPDALDLAEGEAEWKAYLDVIESFSGDRWILIEHVKGHSPDQFPRDAATLKRWLGQG